MTVTWLKTGEESEKLAEQEKAAQEKRRLEQTKAFEFYLHETSKNSGKYEESKIIFVDGLLNAKGVLTPPRFYQHEYIFLNGQRYNLVCPKLTMPTQGETCPLCDAGDQAKIVALFTVIDLKPYTTKKDVVIPFTRKLFVAKSTTFELLNKLAGKRGGLKGCVFDVSRTNGKSPKVGDVFDFQEKLSDEAALKAKFTSTYKTKKDNKEETVTKCLWEPLDYTKEVVFRTGDELRAMGFGAPSSSMNDSTPVSDGNTDSPTQDTGTAADYSNEL